MVLNLNDYTGYHMALQVCILLYGLSHHWSVIKIMSVGISTAVIFYGCLLAMAIKANNA